MGFMKKILKISLLAAVFVFILSLSAIAADDNIGIIIDAEELLPVDANGAYVPPFIENGSTYVPLRAVAEAFSFDIAWDQETMTVFIGEKGGEPLLHEYTNIFIDGSEFEAKDALGNRVYPILRDGTTYMPIRAIGEAFGKTVMWDNAMHCVYILTPLNDSEFADLKTIIDASKERGNISLKYEVYNDDGEIDQSGEAEGNFLSTLITDDMLKKQTISTELDGTSAFFVFLQPADLLNIIGLTSDTLPDKLGMTALGFQPLDDAICGESILTNYTTFSENGEKKTAYFLIEASEAEGNS